MDSDRKPKIYGQNQPSAKPMKMGPVNTESKVSVPSTAPKGGDRKSKMMPKE